MSLFRRFFEILRDSGQKLMARKLRQPLAGLLLLVIACSVIAAVVWPVHAAFELVDYRVRSSQSDILLLWSTAHEYDLSGFEIQCKPASEPDSAYHSIGFREAQGSPQTGAQYFFLVNQNLTPGQSYCFRLREQTTNNLPGELQDRCGYGLGITPTPTLTATLTTTLTTRVALTDTAAIASSKWITLTPVILVTRVITATPIANQSALTASTPITEPTQTPTPLVNSPLPTPLTPQVTPSSVITPGASPVNPGPASQPPSTPITPTLATPSATVTPTLAVTATVAITPSQTVTKSAEVTTNNGIADSGAPGINGASVPVTQTTATPDLGYQVVTATPVPDNLVLLPPMLTPLPTITSAPDINLAAVAQPTTQNVIILLLCFTFFGASGLGVLGLLTSVLYMRSRRATSDRAVSRPRF